MIRPPAQLAGAALLALAVLAAPASAQPRGIKEQAPAAPAAPAEDLATTLAKERDALEKQRAELAALDPAAASAEIDAIDRTIGTIVSYEQTLAESDALTQREEARAGPEVLTQLGAPPYDLDAFDRVQAALAQTQAEITRLGENQRIAADELAATRKDYERREEERRKARETASAGDPDPTAALAARGALRIAELESRRTELRKDLLTKASDNMARTLTLASAEEETLRASVARVRANLKVSPAELARELDARLAKIDLREAALARDLEETQARVAERTTRLDRAQRALEKATDRDPVLVAKVDAYQAELQAEKWRAALITSDISSLSPLREAWRERARVLAGELSRAELRDRASKLTASLDETNRTLRIAQARLSQVRSDAEAKRNDARRDAEANSPTAEWSDREAKSFEGAVAAFEDDVRTLEEVRSVQEKALDDVAARVTVRGWRKPIELVRAATVDAWDQEITSVDDHPITVGKCVIALAVLALGWGGARILAQLLARLVRRRSGAAEGAVRAIESLSFYALLAIFFLIALRIVNIPLTAFALAGGALAVGIGFASQTIINNFMSGLILLTERPIQIGDVIEIDGKQGVVERIGPRSTRIKTYDGVHLIVPNGAFLERNVLNLTLSDDFSRGQVELGVRYGTDPRAVQQILERVVNGHPQVLDDPPPVIEFAAFGESALQFKAFFWIRDVTLRAKVASDVRYLLVDELTKAGIELAHPRRDVHLDARRAVPIRVVREERGPGSDEA